MRRMSGPAKKPELMSLAGPLRQILIPESVGFENPRELGRAMMAWRFDLSSDEIRLLEFVVCGLTNAQIAERMELAEENTVKQRLKVVFRKLGIRHRVQAASIAAQFGIHATLESLPDTSE